MWLRDRRAGAEAELSLVLRLTLERGVDWDRNLLHCCRLQAHENTKEQPLDHNNNSDTVNYDLYNYIRL